VVIAGAAHQELAVEELVVGFSRAMQAGPGTQVFAADVEDAEELEAVGFAEGAERQTGRADETCRENLNGARGGELGVSRGGWG
jgi:hypothetical protein